MHMTFEKIEPENKIEAEPTPEHPAKRAARMIKELHEENIKKIDNGFVFYRKLENGDLQDVNVEMRKQCLEQIAMCEHIIERADVMDPRLFEPAQLILDEVQSTVARAVEDEQVLASMPEIGNYDHKETQ